MSPANFRDGLQDESKASVAARASAGTLRWSSVAAVATPFVPVSFHAQARERHRWTG